MEDKESVEEKVFPFEVQVVVRVNAKNSREALPILAGIMSKIENIDEDIQGVSLKKGRKPEAVKRDIAIVIDR